jgi:hypothetical protein
MIAEQQQQTWNVELENLATRETFWKTFTIPATMTDDEGRTMIKAQHPGHVIIWLSDLT